MDPWVQLALHFSSGISGALLHDLIAAAQKGMTDSCHFLLMEKSEKLEAEHGDCFFNVYLF